MFGISAPVGAGASIVWRLSADEFVPPTAARFAWGVGVAHESSRTSYALAQETPSGNTVAPGVAHLQLRAYAPVVIQGVLIAPGTARQTWTGYAPTVAQGAAIAPGTARLTVRTYAPSVLQGVSIAPGTARLQFRSYAPVVVQGDPVQYARAPLGGGYLPIRLTTTRPTMKRTKR